MPKTTSRPIFTSVICRGICKPPILTEFPDVIEDYDNLSIIPTDSNYAQSEVNSASKLVVLTVGGRPNDVALPNAVLTNGTGSGDPDITRYQGSTADPVDQQTGLLGLSRIRDISLLAVPDEVVLPLIRNDIIQ